MYSWRAWPALLALPACPLPITFLLRGLPRGANSPYPSVPQGNQHRFRCLLLPQLLGREGPGVFPQTFPTSLHSLALHSVNRWWRVCFFPPPHHQHRSLSVLWILSLRYGPIAAHPDKSW